MYVNYDLYKDTWIYLFLSMNVTAIAWTLFNLGKASDC